MNLRRFERTLLSIGGTQMDFFRASLLYFRAQFITAQEKPPAEGPGVFGLDWVLDPLFAVVVVSTSGDIS